MHFSPKFEIFVIFKLDIRDQKKKYSAFFKVNLKNGLKVSLELKIKEMRKKYDEQCYEWERDGLVRDGKAYEEADTLAQENWRKVRQLHEHWRQKNVNYSDELWRRQERKERNPKRG